MELRKLSNNAHRRYPRGIIAGKTRGESRFAAATCHRSRRWLQTHNGLNNECGASRRALSKSIHLDSLAELLVLVADEFDGFFICDKPLIDAHGKRFGIRLGIFNRHVNFELAKKRATKPFGEASL